ncbi:MAG: ABC transporter ATP-binding protein [Bacillus sp. (in: Bacteria)]|nr:ABC transporter ATP-binding protein [Bacillus sp. (in: firmicutes)]
MDGYVIIENLWKSYDELSVLEGIELSIKRGTVFGILGRNGAGKTTLMECLTGLREADIGGAYVVENDHKEKLFKRKEVIGVQPQEYSLFERQTVKETFELFASFYKESLPLPSLIERLKLVELQHKQVRKLSTGQKQRVAIGVALVGNPEIILLDEPTAGLDVQVRFLLWDIIKELKKEGKTILMTTHYMEEAEELCDEIAILHEKKIVALGTTDSVIEEFASSHRKTLSDAFIHLTGAELRLGVD